MGKAVMNARNFWLGFILLCLLPLSLQLHLFLIGKTTDGKVVKYQEAGWGLKPVVEYELDGKTYRFFGPMDHSYLVKQKVKVLYPPNKPESAVILDFIGLYGNMHTVYCLIVLMVWIACYIAYGSWRYNKQESSEQS